MGRGREDEVQKDLLCQGEREGHDHQLVERVDVEQELVLDRLPVELEEVLCQVEP